MSRRKKQKRQKESGKSRKSRSARASSLQTWNKAHKFSNLWTLYWKKLARNQAEINWTRALLSRERLSCSAMSSPGPEESQVSLRTCLEKRRKNPAGTKDLLVSVRTWHQFSPTVPKKRDSDKLDRSLKFLWSRLVEMKFHRQGSAHPKLIKPSPRSNYPGLKSSLPKKWQICLIY